MSEREQRLKALGNYLKSRREKLTPDRVGLPFGYNKRRTLGLKREEVALLAGLSTTWYTWIEQGRDINVSKQVLDSIAKALQLNEDEYVHLLNLAQMPVEISTKSRKIFVSPSIQKVVRNLTYPAMIVNMHADVLSWNKAVSTYLMDFGLVPEKERNMAWQWFTNKSLQSRILNWQESAKYVAAVFRNLCDRYAEDQEFPKIVEDLKKASSVFQEEWDNYEIRQKSEIEIQFRDPNLGKQSFEVTYFLHGNGNQEIYLLVFTPSEKAEKES